MAWTCAGSAGGTQCRTDDPLRLLLHLYEVIRTAEGLGVDLVDILRAARTGREPRVGALHLHSAHRGAVAGGRRELRGDRVAGELGRGDGVAVQPAEGRLLRRRRHGVRALVGRVAEPRDELRIEPRGALAR